MCWGEAETTTRVRVRRAEAKSRSSDPIACGVPKLASCLQIADFSRRASSFCTPHELLAAAPGVRVLATSREPLHVVGESEYPLEPLSESAASELFAARVRDNVPEFVLDDRNREVVTLICRRLDGLPLALELAAARLKLLGFQGWSIASSNGWSFLPASAAMSRSGRRPCVPPSSGATTSLARGSRRYS
jgi:hypothetical protein